MCVLCGVVGTEQEVRLPGGLIADDSEAVLSWFNAYSRLKLSSFPLFMEGVSGLAGDFALTLFPSTAVCC